jgi:hypothetical protein
MFIDYFKKLAKNYNFEKQKIKQNDPGLHPLIRAYGCYFRSLIGIAETTFQKLMTVNQINSLYKNCLQYPLIMNKNCYMGDDLARVVEYAARDLGHEIKCYQRGLLKSGTFIFWNDKYKSYTDTVIQWKTTDGAHYTQADIKMNEIFDPWAGKMSKLYITRILLYEVIV